MKKLRVAVLYGGRSGEHEVSLQSAASVINYLDRDRFEIVPVAIDKQGRWLLNDISLLEGKKSLPVFKDAPKVVLPPNPAEAGGSSALIRLGQSGAPRGIDVVFPVMHGPLCEDGTIQGLLELADLPYVGCGVLASAIAMDKEMAKRVARDAGIPIVPYVSLKHEVWKSRKQQFAKSIAEQLGYPVFVKPANLGSSVGVHKVREPGGLNAALEDSFNYDRKVLVEAAVNAREIELSVLENLEAGADPLVSVPGEIDPAHEFYSYEAKYLDEKGAALIIPANLSTRGDQTRTGDWKEGFHSARVRRVGSSGPVSRPDQWRILFQRAEHDPGFHLHQHVSEIVGSVGDWLPGASLKAGGSCDRAA